MNQARGRAALDALIVAINDHDLPAISGRFTTDVRSETPAHPARSFDGRAQIALNWSQILGAIGDLEARLLATATTPGRTVDRSTVWAEIAFDGHRPDGVPWRMRGVTINEVVGDHIASLRFYLEPVDDDAVGADAAVRAITTGTSAPARSSVGVTR
jgi:hypothetical protein